MTATRDHGPLPGLLLALTVGTGLVDAVSYLTLGHVFVANMTGNVVFFGFAVAGVGGISWPATLLAVGCFGARVHRRTIREHPENPPWPTVGRHLWGSVPSCRRDGLFGCVRRAGAARHAVGHDRPTSRSDGRTERHGPRSQFRTSPQQCSL
ncbi:YoaK family protein [Streptomyces kaempferi]